MLLGKNLVKLRPGTPEINRVESEIFATNGQKLGKNRHIVPNISKKYVQ